MTGIDPMVDYRDTPAPDFGADGGVDKLAFAVCSSGGHIPNYRPHNIAESCDFHRRMAWAYARILREDT